MTGTCVGYVRVSTAGQAEDGESRAMQRERVAAWAVMRGLELSEVYEDEGVSGRTMANRPEAERALEAACGAGCPLVVYSLSRLGRSLTDLVTAMERLRAAGADLVSLTESIDTSTAAGRMMFKVLAVLAEFERELVAERTRDALAAKVAHGERLGTAPYGWFLVDGRLVENPSERDIVREMVRLRDQGLSYRAVAAALDGMGVAPRSGGRWCASTIAGVLGREVSR